jgi:hypothetical protein
MMRSALVRTAAVLVGTSALFACSERGGAVATGQSGSAAGIGMITAGQSDMSTAVPGAGGGSSMGLVSPDAGRAADARMPIETIPSARTSLLLPELWMPLAPAEDPFDDRPAVVDCAPAAVMPEFLSEQLVLGIDTGGCNYFTAMQPIQRAVAVGEIIDVRIWHFQLSAAEPAQAHVAVVVDALPILDERVPIPQAGGLVKSQVQVTRSIAAGAPAYFHLHNHGANSWALVEVSAGP